MAKTWSVRNIYFYLVCLVTLFLIVGGAISAVNNAIQLALPDQPNVPLTQIYFREHRFDGEQPAFDPPSLEKLEELRAERESQFHYQGWAMRRLLNSIALMLIATPFFLYHWKHIKPS